MSKKKNHLSTSLEISVCRVTQRRPNLTSDLQLISKTDGWLIVSFVWVKQNQETRAKQSTGHNDKKMTFKQNVRSHHLKKTDIYSYVISLAYVIVILTYLSGRR